MYDSYLEELKRKASALEGDMLKALAEHNPKERQRLKKEHTLLQKEIRQQSKKASKEASQKRKDQENEIKRILKERFAKSQKGLVEHSIDSQETVTVFQGMGKPDRRFSYGELLQKMKIILEKQKSFSAGNEYRGALFVSKRRGHFHFSYDYYNQDGTRSFKLEASNLDTTASFLKGITLIECKEEPMIEHGIGQRDMTEDDYTYAGDRIIQDLFQSFANGLYRKE